MGFPPIGIMSLSSVLKRAGHECVHVRPGQPRDARTTSSSHEIAPPEARPRRAELPLARPATPTRRSWPARSGPPTPRCKIAFGGVFATLNAQLVKLQCPEVDFVCRGDGEQLILDLLERLDDPDTVAGRHLAGAGRHAPAQPEPPARPRPRPVALPRPREPRPGLRGVDAARRAGRPLARPLHDDADLARLPVALRLLRHPHLQRGQVALAQPGARRRGVQAAPEGRLRRRLLRRRPLPAPAAGASRRSARASSRTGITIQWGCEGRVDSVCMQLFPAMAKAHCRTLMFGIESGSQKILDRLKKEQTLAGDRDRGHQRQEGGHRDRPRLLRGREPRRDRGGHAGRRSGSPRGSASTPSASTGSASTAGTPLWQEYVQRGLVNDATRLVQVLQVLVDRPHRPARAR